MEKLFGFLGTLLSTCSSDLPLLRGEPPHPHPTPPPPRPENKVDQSVPVLRIWFSFQNFTVLSTEGSLRRRKSRPQASLTATHSSTLAEEIVAALRSLHSLSQWNGLINDYINTQLGAVGDVMAGCQSEAVRPNWVGGGAVVPSSLQSTQRFS